MKSRLFFSLCLCGLIFLSLLTAAHAQDDPTVLSAGTYQAETPPIRLHSDAEPIVATGADAEQAVLTPAIEFTTYGTDVIVRWRYDDDIGITMDGWPNGLMPRRVQADAAGWYEASIHSSYTAEQHTFRLIGRTSFEIDTITVLNRPLEKMLPLILVGGVIILIMVALAVWVRRSSAHTNRRAEAEPQSA